MSADKLVFDISQEVEGTPNVFVKKDWLNIIDNQSGQYSSNQSVIDTSQLSNSNKFMNYREAYLSIPLLLTLTSANATADILAADLAPATAATSADYSVGLKNWFGSMIHQFTLDMNGTTICQQTPFINMWNSFKLLTTLSWGDVATMGSSIGFYPDDPTSWTYSAAATLEGQGVCNNSNQMSFTDVFGTKQNAFNSGGGNIGFLKRQQFINYDAEGITGTGATFGSLLTSERCKTLWKSHIVKKQNAVATASQGVYQVAINATVYLKHIHSFFQMCPLMKGTFLKMTLTLNNTSVAVDVDADGKMSVSSSANAVGGICPIMVASRAGGSGGVALTSAEDPTVAASFIANISVGATCLDTTLKSNTTVYPITTGGLSTNVVLYVPAYSFNPSFESAYLSSPIKTIKYTDVYQYQVLNVASGGTINSLLTNGIANIKSVLCLPFHSETYTGSGIAPYASPFDPAGAGPTSPLCMLTNFNIVVSGQNTIYNTQRYGFESFNNHLKGVGAVNGGLTDGLTSGLIDSQAFEMEYCYHYVDVSRALPVEEQVPKSIQVVGTNLSGRTINMICFVEYGVEISIDALTGARV
tara:strand:+ start:12488 stop:14242 length:1755 start_codon:yes stop_codon:yes gene_type:complete